MDSENQKGLLGTIIFHGFLFLCVFLMSFADGGGGGDNGTGEALGGIEVSLGEPDLGGSDEEAGYTPEQSTPVPDEATDAQTLTADNSDAPEIESKKPEVKTTAPKITTPVFKKTTPSTKPVPKIKSEGLYKKGGDKGSGKKPGVEGEDDGSIDGNNGDGDGDGDGDGKKGDGDGDGDKDGPNKGSGPKGKVIFGLKGYIAKSSWNFNPSKSGYGKVIIELCLNKDGSVKSVKHTLGGTMTDKYFIDLAIRAVKNNTYQPTGSTTSDPCGLVTFNIKAQ